MISRIYFKIIVGVGSKSHNFEADFDDSRLKFKFKKNPPDNVTLAGAINAK